MSDPNSCAKSALSDSCLSDHFIKMYVFFNKKSVLFKDFIADVHSVPFLSA